MIEIFDFDGIPIMGIYKTSFQLLKNLTMIVIARVLIVIIGHT